MNRIIVASLFVITASACSGRSFDLPTAPSAPSHVDSVSPVLPSAPGEPLTVRFTGEPFNVTATKSSTWFASTEHEHGIVQWLWDFGDGTTSTLSDYVNHTYALEGDYRLRVTVTDGDGRVAFDKRVVWVAAPPKIVH